VFNNRKPRKPAILTALFYTLLLAMPIGIGGIWLETIFNNEFNGMGIFLGGLVLGFFFTVVWLGALLRNILKTAAERGRDPDGNAKDFFSEKPTAAVLLAFFVFLFTHGFSFMNPYQIILTLLIAFWVVYGWCRATERSAAAQTAREKQP
jgi:hypothetical protein